MRMSVGTSGYSYKEWKGAFYPGKLAAKDMLAWYARELPAVEINNTFYRMPKRSVLEGWAAQVPPTFRFSIKASRRITHFKRLKDTGEELGFLLDNLAALGETLGVVLFQLPPNLKADVDRLASFQDLLPESLPVAFEFRHESWGEPAVLERLRERGHALVVSDTEEAPAAALETTGPHCYVRLRRPDYDRADLAAWAARVRAAASEEAFVFFKHEDDGAGPKLARAFLDVAERSARRRGAKPAAPGAGAAEPAVAKSKKGRKAG